MSSESDRYVTTTLGRHGKQVLSLVLEGLRLNPLLCHLALNTVIQYRYRWLLVKECLEVINKAPQENRITWRLKKKKKKQSSTAGVQQQDCIRKSISLKQDKYIPSA